MSPIFVEMDAERLKQIEEIYHAVLELPESDRETFFKENCGDDESLRREVESLIAFENTSDNFIDTPPDSLAAEMFSDKQDQPSLINQIFGHYKIKQLLGKGGMGEVYLAEDTRLNRRVALKFLSGSLSADLTRLRRFEREAFSASALNHPNILTIYEFGSENGTYFLASEFVEGETLREFLHNGELTLKKILSIAEQTALALAAAHRNGIIHRDIKPENIMIRSEDGIVKVLDFGLAKLTEKRRGDTETRRHGEEDNTLIAASPRPRVPVSPNTEPGMILGTVSYMSPEQTRGLATIDARSDVWSLGIVLFEMLTGKTPFEGETMSDVIASILKSEVPPISKVIPDLPSEIERIVEKSLQKDREERYQVIKDLALDLKSVRKDLEFSAQIDRSSYGSDNKLTTELRQRQTTVAEIIKRFSAFNLVLMILVAGLSLSGAWWFFGRNNKPTEIPETYILKAIEIANWSSSPGEIYSVGSFSPDAKMVAFASTRSGSRNIWVKQTTSGEAVQITKDEFDNKNPVWSPNGEELAFFSIKGNLTGIWRIPVLGGSPVFVAESKDGGSQLKFWSKQNLIYYESKNEIFAVDVNSGQVTKLTDFAAVNIKARSLNISNDEKQIAYLTTENNITNLWSADSKGNLPKKLFSGPNEIKNVVWLPDNKRILFSSSVDGTFQIFVTDIYGMPPQQLTSAETDNLVLDVSSDSTKILYGSAKEESDIWSVNLKDRKEFNLASDIDSELWADVSPDGKTIAYQAIKNLSQGNKIFSGKILTKNFTQKAKANVIVSNGSLPKWSPDGKTLAFLKLSGDKLQIDTIKTLGGEQKSLTKEGISSISFSVLPYNRLQASDISWSPDSQKIAYISDRSGQSNIWMVNADGSDEVQLTTNDTNLYYSCPLWSTDGKRIAFTSKTGNAEGKPTFSVSVLETDTKKIDPILNGNTFIRLVGWSQSGSDLILASIEGSGAFSLMKDVTLLQVQIETKKLSELVKLTNTYLFNIHLSIDKKTIAFVAHREEKDNVWIMPVAGGQAKQVTGNNDSRLYFSSMAWSPDNNTIFFGKQSRYSLLSMLTNFK